MSKRFSISKGILSLVLTVVAIFGLVACEDNNNQELVDAAYDALEVAFETGDSANSVTQNLTLPTSVEDVTVAWTSSNTAVISNSGVVTRGQNDTVVTLTATITLGKVEEVKTFTVTVLAAEVVVDPLDALDAIVISGYDSFDEANSLYTTTETLFLQGSSMGLVIEWRSSNVEVITHSGVVYRPAWNTSDEVVILTAHIGEETRDFAVKVLAITVKPDSAKVQDAYDSLLLAGIGDGVAADLTLPETAGNEGVTVTWSSDTPDVISNEGVVTRQEEQVTVVLTATLTLGTVELEKEFEVIVLPFAPSTTVASIADALSLYRTNKALEEPVDTYAKLEGVTIVGVSGDGYMITDGASLLFVYTGGTPSESIVAGQAVDITGYVDYYYGSYQFNGSKNTEMPTIVKPSDATPHVLVPDQLPGTLVDYIAGLPTTFSEEAGFPYQYVEFEAKIRVQGTGNYDVFLVDLDYDGADINSAANSPKTENALMIYYKSNIAAIREFDGAKVRFSGFLYSYRSDRTIFTVIFTGTSEDIEILPLTDQESVDGAEAGVLNAIPAQQIENGTLALPTDLLGTTITYTSSNEAVINPTTGLVTRVEETQTEVILTATIVKGEASKVVPVTVLVGELPLVTIQDVIDAPTNSFLYKVRGTVTAAEYQNTYFIQNGDTGIAIYTGDSALEAILQANLGKEIEVTGNRAEHNGLRQMSPTEITVIGDGVTPAAVNVDAVDLNAEDMLVYQGRLVTLTQLLVADRAVDDYGNVTLTLEQLSSGLTIKMKWDSRVTLAAAAATLLEGIAKDDIVDVTTVMAWNNNPYLYFTDTTVVTEVAMNDTSKVALDASALSQPAAFTEAGTLTLPETGANGSAIVWTTESTLIDINTGSVTLPASGQVTAILTATLSLNSVTKVVEFEIALGTPNYATDLFISEYIEGGSNNKALEIFNGTGATVDLTGYKVGLYSNGSSEIGNNIELTGTLAHGETLVIVNAGATADFKVEGSIESTVTYFNGDDAVALLKNDVVIDVIGVIGVDPGSSWPVGTGSTANYTLVRTSSVLSPNTVFTASEWEVYAQDTSTYIGSHVMA